MSLATFTDANVHLDGKKIEFLEAEDAAPEATSADRYIRGMLHSVYGDDVNLWEVTPTLPQVDTPELIREAAAFLMAYFRYSKIYSEETMSPNSYAMQLKNQADAILEGLIDGTIELVDFPTAVDVGQPSFFPDDEYIDINTLEPIRMFTVEKEF